MKIENNTPEVKAIEVEEIVGGRSYEIYIEPYSTTEIEGLLLINDTNNVAEPVVEQLELSVETMIDGNHIDTAEDVESIEVSDQDDNKFICDECGSEFASARGLATHKNKAHSN